MPEDRDALVEKVARALRSVDIEAVPEGILTQAEREDFYRKAARAAIASILPPTTSAGDGELVEHLQERLLNEQMLAFKWMDAHDKLKAGKPYSFPAPADLPDALARVKELEEALAEAQGYVLGNHDEGCELDPEFGEQNFNTNYEAEIEEDIDAERDWPDDARCTCGTNELVSRIDAALNVCERGVSASPTPRGAGD